MIAAEPWQQAERNLIGAVLLEPAAYWSIADKVSPEDFAKSVHRRIWAGIVELSAAGSWSPELLADHLNLLAVVAELRTNAPGSANVAAYATRVAKYSDHRRLMAAVDAMAKLDVDHVDQALPMLVDSQRKTATEVRRASQVMATYIAEMQRRYDQKEELTGVPSGYPMIDAMTGGWQDGDLIVIAARPSMGKTAFMGQAVTNCAVSSGPALVFTIEMSAEQLVNRMVSARSSVTVDCLNRPKTIPDEVWPRINQAMGVIDGLPIHFDETPAVSITQVMARARQVKAQHGLRLIALDYLQIMAMRNPDDPVRSLKEITGSLKQLGKELKVPVMALSQLNRSVEQRADKRPMPSDLRDSGTIEQDADIVAFLYRDEYYNRDTSPDKGFAEFIIAKQRNGPTGMVPLRTELQFCRFHHTDDPLPSSLMAPEDIPTTRHPVAGRPFKGRGFGRSRATQ